MSASTEYFRTVDGLLELIANLMEAWRVDINGIVDPPLEGGEANTEKLLVAITDRICELADAVIALWKLEQRGATVPLSRIALEAATLAAWLSIAPGAERALFHEMQRSQALAVRELQPHVDRQDTQEMVDRFWQRMKESDEYSLPEAGKVEQRMKELSVGPALYASYRTLSESVHPGYSLIHRDKNTEPLEQASLGFLALSLFLSIGAWVRHIPQSDPQRIHFEVLAARLGFDIYPEYVGTRSEKPADKE